MCIDGLTLPQLERIAEQTGVALYNVRVHPLKPTRIDTTGLRPANGKYQKRSPRTGRRVWAVCYHGHYEFMRRVFEANREARITTTLLGRAVYNGKTEFEEKAPTVGDRNLGSPARPAKFRTACACEG